MKSKAYAYVRYSTERQSQGDSEHRQLSPLEAFTASTGVPVVEVVYDKGVSAYRGSNAKTGNLGALIERIEAGEIGKGDYLVVESIDRLTRQRLIVSTKMLLGFLNKGIRIYTTIDQKCYEVDDPNRDLETLIMVQVIAKRANEESETKSKRLIASWKSRHEKAKQGHTIITRGKSIPFGLRVVDGEFIREESECLEVERLFTLMLDVGINSAIKQINLTSSRKWTTGHIQKIIESRSVIGCLTLNKITYTADGASKKVKVDVVEGYYPNIIDPSLFWKVRDRMGERKAKNFTGRTSARNYNIFQHVIYCGCCGLPMFYDHRGSSYLDKVYPHFKCESKIDGSAKCINDRIRFEYVFKAFIEYLDRVRIWNEAEVSRNPFLGHSKELSTDLAEQLKGMAGINQLTKQAKDELKAKENTLAEARTIYENMKQSLDGFMKQSQGNVPSFMLERLGGAERALQTAMDEVEKARASIGEGDELANLTLNDLIKLYSSEEGRKKLNGFLKANRIHLKALHNKADKVAKIEVYQSLGMKNIRVASITVHTGKPKQKRVKGQKAPEFNILAKYGIELQAILNEVKHTSPMYQEGMKRRRARQGI